MKGKLMIVLTAAVLLLAACGETAVPAVFVTPETTTTQPVETSTVPTEQTQPLPPAQTEPTTPAVQKAPDFTVLDSAGNAVSLSDFAGKPVVLNVWATWCRYCLVEMPEFQLAAEKYPDVQFMMINATDGVQETMETAKAYIAEQGFTFPVFYDTQLDMIRTYGVSAFPTTFFIDSEGNLIAGASGAMDLATLEQGLSMIR